MSAKRILLTAASDIEKYGLAKGVFLQNVTPGGWRKAPACALGAIARAGDMVESHDFPIVDTDAVTEHAATLRLAKVVRPSDISLTTLRNDTYTRYSAVTNWSDAKERTAAEVAAAMRKAAE